MVEIKISFTFGDVTIFGNVAWFVARLFHHLPAGIYFNSARKTGTLHNILAVCM